MRLSATPPRAVPRATPSCVATELRDVTAPLYCGTWLRSSVLAHRNPGSVSPVMPELVGRGLVEDCRVGKVSVVYRLRTSDPRVHALMGLKESLKAGA